MNLDASYSLKYYLFSLARNYALNYLKHLRVIEVNTKEFSEQINDSIEEIKEYEEKVVRLEQKLKNLPDQQYKVIIQCFMEGKKYKEVADELKISVNTVRNHLVQALKYLRNEMKEDIVLLFCLKKN